MECASSLAGLDMDFRGEPFGPMPLLMAEAEEVTKLQAICVVCGAPASRTQRLIDDLPAGYDDPIILVGGSESYEARCRTVPRGAGRRRSRLRCSRATLYVCLSGWLLFRGPLDCKPEPFHRHDLDLFPLVDGTIDRGSMP